jgi:hypothetical protein
VTPPLRGAKRAKAAASGPLYTHEIRKEGRPVVKLTAVTNGDATVTVETEVFPVTLPPGQSGVRRPFRFAGNEAAERFAEETLLALEYLNCDVVD